MPEYSYDIVSDKGKILTHIEHICYGPIKHELDKRIRFTKHITNWRDKLGNPHLIYVYFPAENRQRVKEFKSWKNFLKQIPLINNNLRFRPIRKKGWGMYYSCDLRLPADKLFSIITLPRLMHEFRANAHAAMRLRRNFKLPPELCLVLGNFMKTSSYWPFIFYGPSGDSHKIINPSNERDIYEAAWSLRHEPESLEEELYADSLMCIRIGKYLTQNAPTTSQVPRRARNNLREQYTIRDFIREVEKQYYRYCKEVGNPLK